MASRWGPLETAGTRREYDASATRTLMSQMTGCGPEAACRELLLSAQSRVTSEAARRRTLRWDQGPIAQDRTASEHVTLRLLAREVGHASGHAFLRDAQYVDRGIEVHDLQLARRSSSTLAYLRCSALSPESG